jgi:hypothetical protein
MGVEGERGEVVSYDIEVQRPLKWVLKLRDDQAVELSDQF